MTKPQRRRPHGSGSTYFDAAKGLWVGTIDFGTVGGKRKRVTRKARTEVELAAKLTELNRQKANGQIPARLNGRETSEWTVERWMTHYLDQWLPGRVAAGTLRTYRSASKDWIVPYLGPRPLLELHQINVDEWQSWLATERKLAPATIVTARGILKRALDIAMRYDAVPRNVVTLTDAPKVPPRPDEGFTVAEAEAVLDACAGHRYEAMYYAALMMGVRQAELMALDWTDIDFTAKTMLVRGTKTAAAWRTIAIPEPVLVRLRRHKANQASERLTATYWADPDVVFATKVGTRLWPRDVRRQWHNLLDRAEVRHNPDDPSRRFHLSRHTAGTLMLNHGVPLEVVSKTLGHAHIGVTARHYAKVRDQLQRTAADAMEQLFGKQADGS